MFKKKKLDINDIKIENTFFRNIEFNRVKFVSNLNYKNNIIFIIVCICSAVLLISLFFISNILILFFLITFNFLFLFIYCYFFYFRQKNQVSNAYLNVFFENLNSFVFKDLFNDMNVSFQSNTSYEEDKKLFFDSNIFKDVFCFQNQNSIHLKVNNVNINLFDCTAQKRTFKKLEYLFIGKFLFIPNDYAYDNEIIVFLSKNVNNNVDNSTSRLNFFCSDNINSFIKIFSDQNISIFAKNAENVPNDLIKSITKTLIVSEILTNAIISIQKNKTYFCLNYIPDNLLNPPFNQKFNSVPIMKFKNDLQNLINVLVRKA